MSSNDNEQTDRPAWQGYAQVGAVLLVIAVLIIWAQAPAAPASAMSAGQGSTGPLQVDVLRPSGTSTTVPVELTGTVTAQVQLSVLPDTSGRIVWVSPKFRTGGSLDANETIVRLDPEDLELGVRGATAEVARAEAILAREKTRAAAAVRIYGNRAPGPEGFEWVGREHAVKASEAALERARAGLAQAQLRLSKTNVSLPFASRIVVAAAEVGQVTGPNQPIGQVYRADNIEVTTPIDTRVLTGIAPAVGRSARVETEAGIHMAEVTEVSSIVTQGSRMSELRLQFGPGQDSLPVPGMFAEVTIDGPMRNNVFVLSEAVRQENGRVWMVGDGRLQAVQPRSLGTTAVGWVVEAFDAGDGLVVGAPPNLREGLEVAVANADGR